MSLLFSLITADWCLFSPSPLFFPSAAAIFITLTVAYHQRVIWADGLLLLRCCLCSTTIGSIRLGQSGTRLYKPVFAPSHCWFEVLEKILHGVRKDTAKIKPGWKRLNHVKDFSSAQYRPLMFVVLSSKHFLFDCSSVNCFQFAVSTQTSNVCGNPRGCLKPLTRCTRRGGVWVNTAFDVRVLKFTAAASLYHHPASARLVVLNYLQLGGITPSADSFLSDMGALLWFQRLLSSLLESAFKEEGNWHWKKGPSNYTKC